MKNGEFWKKLGSFRRIFVNFAQFLIAGQTYVPLLECDLLSHLNAALVDEPTADLIDGDHQLPILIGIRLIEAL